MQSNPKAATAALELEHYFTSQTYGHAAAFALAAELASPHSEQAQDSNLGVPEDAPSGLTDRNGRTAAKEAPIDPRPTGAETQRSA